MKAKSAPGLPRRSAARWDKRPKREASICPRETRTQAFARRKAVMQQHCSRSTIACYMVQRSWSRFANVTAGCCWIFRPRSFPRWWSESMPPPPRRTQEAKLTRKTGCEHYRAMAERAVRTSLRFTAHYCWRCVRTKAWPPIKRRSARR